MGDTATSVNQGGASGSTGIQEGGKQMRMAAAEARRVLVEMAAGLLSVPADKLTVNDGVVSATDDKAQAHFLCANDRRQVFQRPARLEQEIRQSALCARQSAAEEAERAQNRRPADQARRRGAQGVRARGLRHRRESAGHGARPHDSPSRCRRGAGEGGRQRDQEYSGRQGGLGQGLPRRRRRQGMGRHPGGRKTESGMVDRDAAVPGSGQALRSHPQGAGAYRESREAERQCRGGVQDRRKSDRGRLRMAVPIACQHGPGLRAGRDQGRPGHLLERDAEIPLRAAGPGAHARHAGGQGARDS